MQELEIEDITLGEGREATGRGQTVIVHYAGWLEDGAKFIPASTETRPSSFRLVSDMSLKAGTRVSWA